MLRLFALSCCASFGRAAYTPLVQAVLDGDGAVLRTLATSVDVNEATSSYGRSTGVTALMVAAFTEERARRDELVAVLLEAGAEVDSEADDGMTAMRIAVQNNQPTTAALLLRAGANPDGTERSGNPLTLAAQLGHVGCGSSGA